MTAPVDDLAYALTWVADITEQAAPAASLPQAAVYYASIGWPVLPLEPGGKRPLGRLVPNGLHDASTDPAVVAGWWAQQRAANIGVRTGDRFDVVDLDVKNGVDGIASFWQLCEETGSRPTLLGAVLTPSGGRHLLLEPCGRGNMAGIRPGVDLRGVGGFVVVAPSIIGGILYKWVGAGPSAALLSDAA